MSNLLSQHLTQIYTFNHSAPFLEHFTQTCISDKVGIKIIPEPTLPTSKSLNSLNQTELLKVLSEQIKMNENHNIPFYTFFFSAGTRFLYPFTSKQYQYSPEETCKRFSGRNIRLYHMIIKPDYSTKPNSIKIFHGKLKFQILSSKHQAHLTELLQLDPSQIFLGPGLQYITQINGHTFSHNILRKLFEFLK